MIHAHDAIRSRLEKQIRPSNKDRPPLESLRKTEWIPEFEQYMRNRLVMGALRYETIEEKMSGNTYDFIQYIRDKCNEYDQSHNLECLVDIANVAMLEFRFPYYKDAHFTAIDDAPHVGKK